MRAAEAVAAVGTKQGGGEAAAVQVNQRQPALRQIVAQQGKGLRRQAVFGLELTHVENFHLWRPRLAAGAFGQRQQAVAALLRVAPALQTGGGAAQYRRAAALPRTPYRQIAGVVAQFVVLLERSVVFFIDHNQPQIGQRREHRQPRADQQFRFAGHCPQIVAAALAGGGLAVQHGGGDAGKTPRHALHQLRREIDFRQQKQHLPPRCQRLRGGFKIDFGFAAAGDAVEQKSLISAQGSLNGLGGFVLAGV